MSKGTTQDLTALGLEEYAPGKFRKLVKRPRNNSKATKDRAKSELAKRKTETDASNIQRINANREAMKAGLKKATVKESLTVQKRRSNKHEESDMQQFCVRWFRAQYKHEVLLSIPNGAHLAGTAKQRAIKASIMKREGMLAGASDLLLIHDGGVAFLEAKTKAGVLSEKQKLFRAMVEGMGYDYLVFRSFDEFVKIVKEIMK